jgi:hypothetical protein
MGVSCQASLAAGALLTFWNFQALRFIRVAQKIADLS